MEEIYFAARQAGLSPLLVRMAAIVAQVEGPDRARLFIEAVQEEDALQGDRRPLLPGMAESIEPIRAASPARHPAAKRVHMA